MHSYKFMRLNKNYSPRTHKLSEYLSRFNGLPTVNTGAAERVRALESEPYLSNLLVAHFPH